MNNWKTILHCGNEKESILLRQCEDCDCSDVYIVGFSDELKIMENVNTRVLIAKNFAFSTLEEAMESFYKLPFTTMFPIEIDRSISFLMVDIVPQINDENLRSLWINFFILSFNNN